MERINKKLTENIISLVTIKGLQYILAFITFPYLTRALQVEKFGAVVLSQSIIQYFVLFTDYGFNLTGPREIAQHDSIEERGKVFANVFFAKLFLLMLATIIFAIALVGLKITMGVSVALYAIVYLMVIGNVLFPIWFFQGIQQMRYITYVNIIARIFSVGGIFYFVRKPEDYLLAAFFQAVVPVVAAIASWVIIASKYSDVMCLPTVAGVKNALKDGWTIFTSTIATNLYTASNVVFLGMLTSPIVVGYFSGAKKIIDNVTSLFSPITQAIYPHINKRVAESESKAVQFLRKVLIVLGGGNFCLAIFILVFAEWIVRLLLGTGYEQSVLLLRIMAFLPCIIALSNVFGIQTMLPFGMQSAFSKVLMSAAVINTVLVFPLIYLYQGVGVCVSITITEFFVTTTMFYILKKRGICIWRKQK